MHVILVWTCIGSSLGGMITRTEDKACYTSDGIGVSQVYIGNPTNCDTRSHGYQLASMDRLLMEVDDTASVVIQQPPADPSQMAVLPKKVQTMIWRCMVSIGYTLGCTPSQHDIQQTFPIRPARRRTREHVPDRGARGVKRGACRQPGRGAGSGCPPVPSVPQARTCRPRACRGGERTSQTPPPPGLGFASFQHHILYSSGFLGFVHPLLRARPVHLHRISLYRRHLRLMKRSGRMTWMGYNITDSGIVLQQNIPNTHDRNTTSLPEHITTVTQMVSDEPSMLYNTVNNDDDEVDGSNGDDAVSNQSESDDDNDSEEGEFQTPLNIVNPVNQVTEMGEQQMVQQR
ncbi:hypothetical protein M9H77_27453 [Catharanthus roseus]|uniref:Uncharacterized protein n=1 Tax=Catharanthus roseus TaxID=4058 RepID=A0ACC0ACR6_CATRO|nr:hypothetical protein M9H77_27453 [Catharanthus roseus]